MHRSCNKHEQESYLLQDEQEERFCNVPEPPTGKEDATIHQIIRASSPTNMNIPICNSEA